MPIYITNPEAEALAREVAEAAGETITDAVIAALRDRRDKLRQPSKAERLARLREISKRSAAIIAGRTVDFDELYDQWGAPK